MSRTPLINLPTIEKEDSAATTKLFFDSYGQTPLEFGADEVNYSVNFFLSKGFAEDAAKATASVLLRQARIDGVKVFEIIDQFTEFNGLQLGNIVAEILNRYRPNTSTLGFREILVSKPNQTRNIRP
jgi:hypothetical protein